MKINRQHFLLHREGLPFLLTKKPLKANLSCPKSPSVSLYFPVSPSALIPFSWERTPGVPKSSYAPSSLGDHHGDIDDDVNSVGSCEYDDTDDKNVNIENGDDRHHGNDHGNYHNDHAEEEDNDRDDDDHNDHGGHDGNHNDHGAEEDHHDDDDDGSNDDHGEQEEPWLPSITALTNLRISSMAEKVLVVNKEGPIALMKNPFPKVLLECSKDWNSVKASTKTKMKRIATSMKKRCRLLWSYKHSCQGSCRIVGEAQVLVHRKCTMRVAQ